MKPHPEWMRERARELYIPGVFGYKRVAQQLGVGSNTVARWLDPEAAERQRASSRAQKRRIWGICLDCGGPTSPTSPSHPVKRCLACEKKRVHANRRWNKQTVIEAIHRWHQEHGRRPTATDWICGGPHHPAVTSIYAPPNPIFPSWSAALKAAGYKNVRTNPGPGTQWFDRREARVMRKQGLPDTEIAKQLGVSPSAIYLALGPRGKQPPPKPKRKRSREERIADLQRALARQGAR